MACPCPCCAKLGACCNGGACTQETCEDCEAAGGLYQGRGTACDGTDCPCDPPADHTLCEKCEAAASVDRCSPGENCCDGVCTTNPCDCCCLNGSPDYTKTTQVDCEAVGGAWVPFKDCQAGKCSCYCDEYRYLCIEKVYSYYGFTWSASTASGNSTPDNIPTSQPAGTLQVWSTGAPQCAGTVGMLQDHQNFSGTYCYIDDPCDVQYGDQAYRQQWYYRSRLVDDCVDCGAAYTYPFVGEGDPTGCTDPGDPTTWSGVCFEGADVVACTQITDANCLASDYYGCAVALGLSACANEFP